MKRNISALPKISALAAYKRAWHGLVGYAKRIRESRFTIHFEIGLHIIMQWATHKNLIVGTLIYYIAGLSPKRIPSLAAYKQAWRIFVGYAKRIRETSFTSHFEIGLLIWGVVNHTTYKQEYRSGHNEAVLKICRSIGRQNAETPWKHWLFRDSKNCKNSHI